MPALTGPPVVLVFHSNAKISNAKIKKYTFASERGISSYEEFRTTPPPGTAHHSSPSVGSMGASVDAHPAKRQRVQGQTAVPTSHMHPNAFAPRKRKRRPRHIFDLSRDIYFEDGITPAPEPEFPFSSDDESDMPPPRAPLPPLPVRQNPQNPPPRPPTPEDLEYGAGFASYYVVEDDDEERKGAAKAPPVRATAPSNAHSAPRQPLPQSMHAPHPHRAQRHRQERPYQPRQPGSHRASDVPSQFRPIPPPTINIIDNIKRNYTSDKKATVAEMVSKLEILSVALVNFGGVPPHSSSVANRAGVQAGDSSTGNNATGARNSGSAATDGGDESVNGLLAMFDDDDDDEDDSNGDEAAQSEEVEKPESPAQKGLNYTLPTTGTHDGALRFGIEFIMNALRTWASQRVNAIYTQRWQQYNEMMRQQQHQQVKKARGRPKKDDPHHRQQAPYPPPPPSVVNEQLTNTPEGEAVQAFRDVLDCGVLQVNGYLPVELTRALGTLYVQIDHLINNSARDDPPFEYMSYSAQIKAHNIMVERWRDQITKMQAELAKQQELSHQQMMTQMNVPPHLQHRGVMSHEQALKHHDMHLELRRGEQQAGQLPQLAQYLTTPMDLHSNKTTPTPKTSSNSPANAGAASAPNANTNFRRQSDSASAQPSSSRAHDAMSRITLYHDGKPANVAPEHLKALSMRSGQGMKFSFDHGEKARQLFGDSAFPKKEKSSNLPRRGPMSRSMDHPATVNGTRTQTSTPVLGSNTSPPNMPRKASESSKDQVNGTAARRPSTAHSATNGVKEATTTNGNHSAKSTSTTTNGNTPAPSTPNSMGPPTSHKRKLSDNITVNGSNKSAASASAAPASAPPPGKKPTIKLRTSTRSSAAAAAAAAAADE